FTTVSEGDRLEAFRARGVEVVSIVASDGRIDPSALLDELGRRGVTTLLVEGGAEVHRAFLKAGVVDELRVFLAPSVLGADGLSWVGGLGVETPAEAPRFTFVSTTKVGEDLLIVARPERSEG